MQVDINIHDLVYNFKTKYKEGFVKEEVIKIFNMFKNINENKFNDALFGITAMVINGETIIYHCDIELALTCGLNNRQKTEAEFD